MKKRQKKSNIPRHKRLNRASRLQAAKCWIPKYEGENIVKGYSKHFAVDKLCAINELQMLGYNIDPEYAKQLKESLEMERKAKELRRQLDKEKRMVEAHPDSDDTFYYIAGYTSGGAPYGVTWEEYKMNNYETEDDVSTEETELFIGKDDDIPF